MRILIGHNHHARPGGVEVMFHMTVELLRQHGHEVVTVERENARLVGLRSRLVALGSSLHSPSAKREIATLIRDHRIEVALFFNLFPQLSTSVIDACWNMRVPVVLSVNDYKFVCPTGQHLRRGRVCERCVSGLRELNCALTNCRDSWPMSIAYAVGNAVVRWRGVVRSRVAAYVVPTTFVGNRLVLGGFPWHRIQVVPTPFDLETGEPRHGDGDYAAYVGRISPEKGLPVLIEAARRTGYPTRIAGDPAPMPELAATLPPNVSLVGQLTREQLPGFYRRARFLVIPSVFYEPFAIVNVEAKSFGVPAIASDIGGLPELVEHERTGLLFTAGDAGALATSMKRLWENPGLCRQLGEAARAKANFAFTREVHHGALIKIMAASISERTSGLG